MKTLATRVARMEQSDANSWTPALERKFWAAVDERAARFASREGDMTDEARTELRRFDHIAWLRRFRDKADLPVLMDRYGLTVPRSLIEFIGMTMVFVAGDDEL